jgi:hypothetical protein
MKEKNKKIYKCEICNYNTERSLNYERHCLSRKHIHNIENGKREIKTNIDENEIINKLIKQQDNYEEKIKEIEFRYEMIMNEYKMKIKEQNNIIKETSDLSLSYYVNGMSKIQKIKKYLCNNPELKAIGGDKSVFPEYNESYELVMELIYYNKRGLLHKFIGDAIVKNYKKDNIKDQSIFTTDVSRLSYVLSIRDVNASDDRTLWISDKMGYEMGEKIVEPVLKYLVENIRNYYMNYEIIFDNKKSKYERSEDFIEVRKVDGLIYDNRLKLDIIKYLAPHFNFMDHQILHLMDN